MVYFVPIFSTQRLANRIKTIKRQIQNYNYLGNEKNVESTVNQHNQHDVYTTSPLNYTRI